MDPDVKAWGDPALHLRIRRDVQRETKRQIGKTGLRVRGYGPVQAGSQARSSSGRRYCSVFLDGSGKSSTPGIWMGEFTPPDDQRVRVMEDRDKHELYVDALVDVELQAGGTGVAPDEEGSPGIHDAALHQQLGLVTLAQLGQHTADLYAHPRPYNTPNTGTTNAGKWSRMATGLITERYGEKTCHVSIGGGGSLGTTWTRGFLRFRIRQEAAFGSQPAVKVEVINVADMVPADISLVVTSVVGPTLFELHARPTRAQEWMVLQPEWESPGLGAQLLTWLDCQAFASALPSGTPYGGVA